MSSVVNSGADYGSNRELALVNGEDDASEMSGRGFVDVDLCEGEEPADGDT